MRNNDFYLTNLFSKHWQSILSLLILCAFLCATISHSAHSELILDNAELQQCKLCQHNIDTPPNNLTVKLVNNDVYDLSPQIVQTLHSENTAYLIPQLRAPPIQ